MYSSKMSHGGRLKNNAEIMTGHAGEQHYGALSSFDIIGSPKPGKELTLYKLNKRLKN